MEIQGCNQDKQSGIVTIQFTGKYNEKEVVKTAKENYSDTLGQIVDVQMPTKFKGMENYGRVLIF